MGNALTFLLAFFATWVVLLTLTVLALRWKLQKRNRVSPAVKSPAPIHWLVSPGQTARLHRRLQGAVTDIHLAPTRRTRRAAAASSVDEMRRELEYQAVELDYHLVIAARHTRAQRRPLVASLDAQVTQVEMLSARLSRLSRPAGQFSSGWDAVDQPPEVLARLSQQLDHLDAANDELTQIERASGLDVNGFFLPKHPDAAATAVAAPLPAAPRTAPPPPPSS
jgi:hypothetical protein